MEENIRDAMKAYYKALETVGSNKLKAIACGSPKWAYHYALEVDKVPSDKTRAAACKDPKWAFEYAKNIDGQPYEETHRAVLNTNYQDAYDEIFLSLEIHTIPSSKNLDSLKSVLNELEVSNFPGDPKDSLEVLTLKMKIKELELILTLVKEVLAKV